MPNAFLTCRNFRVPDKGFVSHFGVVPLMIMKTYRKITANKADNFSCAVSKNEDGTHHKIRPRRLVWLPTLNRGRKFRGRNDEAHRPVLHRRRTLPYRAL
jgi:hypothetical protein